MKIIKITNTHWLPNIGVKVAEFAKKINVNTIMPETLYSYFSNIVQFGGDKAEFQVVMDAGKPIAFASWAVAGFPHTGATYLDYIYNWSKKKDAVRLLVDEWLEFGKRNRCKYYRGAAINKQTLQIFEAYAKEIDLTFNLDGFTFFTCWKG